MTAIARTLDDKLKLWRPETASRVEKLVSEIIELADQEAKQATSALAPDTRSRRDDAFLADKAFFSGPGPTDCALNHDKYLYGDAE